MISFDMTREQPTTDGARYRNMARTAKQRVASAIAAGRQPDRHDARQIERYTRLAERADQDAASMDQTSRV